MHRQIRLHSMASADMLHKVNNKHTLPSEIGRSLPKVLLITSYASFIQCTPFWSLLSDRHKLCILIFMHVMFSMHLQVVRSKYKRVKNFDNAITMLRNSVLTWERVAIHSLLFVGVIFSITFNPQEFQSIMIWILEIKGTKCIFRRHKIMKAISI